MHVIGTAGHVDHGKSTLIEALTGIDPDRLREEKERALTIDLGFAWMNLERNGVREEVGIVDVPGHRDFIENMLAGIGGIDLALLVVAADEGVMPQTKEHLAILDLLQVPAGVVTLTKLDLVQDSDWLELVTLDVSDTLAGTVLEDASIIPVSARTGTGLETLRDALAQRLGVTEHRPDVGKPRLSIDRVFSLSGFGTIVTGTLVHGRLQVGDPVEIQPTGYGGRIRGLQTHKTKRDVAQPGSRVAVNVSGIDTDEISRGDVLCAPGTMRGTTLFDAGYRHLPDSELPLKHNVEVKLFVGAAEVMARTRLLGARQIRPGESGWLQLELQDPVAILRGDRFILRRPSPGTTLGGGQILDPHPERKHRRFHPQVTDRLQTLAEGTPEELLLDKLRQLQPVLRKELFARAALEQDKLEKIWNKLLGDEQVMCLGEFALSQTYRRRLRERITRSVGNYHEKFPLRPGMPREELRSRVALPVAFFNAFLQDAASDEVLVETGTVVKLPEHDIRFTQQQQENIDALLQEFEASGVNSPSVKECRAQVGDEVYEALLALDKLRQLNEDVVYHTPTYEALVTKIVSHLEKKGKADAAEIRDLLDTSRKYAIALLEHLDQQRITRRVGDDRILVTDR